MEIIQNRYGQERVIEKISLNRLRIMGDSLIYKQSLDKNGNIKLFDFEGGPFLSVGGKIKFLNSDWLIKSIKVEDVDKENFYSLLLDVELQY